jgi:hypothetical protein
MSIKKKNSVRLMDEFRVGDTVTRTLGIWSGARMKIIKFREEGVATVEFDPRQKYVHASSVPEVRDYFLTELERILNGVDLFMEQL